MSTTARRCLTVPLYLGLAAAAPFVLLFAAPITVLIDLGRASNWAGTRALVFLCFYVTCEAAGIFAAALIWLAAALAPSLNGRAYQRANFRLQCWWAGALFGGIEKIFSIRTDIVGAESIDRGPFLVFSRHASSGDTLLPAVFISKPHNILLRHVRKEELLWDPCLDIVGHRLRNCFVDRHALDPAQEIEDVAALADDLGECEGVVIFPEGSRFAVSKRERALHKLGKAGDDELLRLAQTMRNVLPPKLGGPLALLQRNLGTDLVLLAHTGFEGAETLADLFNGSLIGSVIKMRFWRIARADIPTDPRRLRSWLFETWTAVDQWIEDTKASGTAVTQSAQLPARSHP